MLQVPCDDACKRVGNNPHVGAMQPWRRTENPMDERQVTDIATERYSAAADDAVASLCGVGYRELVEINPGLDPGAALLAHGRETAMPVTDFADAFRTSNGLHEGDGDMNRYRAALRAFSDNSRWKMEGEGPARMSTAYGELELDVVRKDGQMGFGVRLQGQPEADAHVRLDIGDAITGMMHQLRKGVDMQQDMGSPGMGR
jgi:hypothetical protein